MVVALETQFFANTTIYAQWTPILYTVTFNLDDGGLGTPPESISAVYDSRLTLAQKPSTADYTKAGYANDGKWYTRTETTGSTTIFTENFENSTNGWVLVNGSQTNKWMIGTATYYAGSYSAYISSNGSANSYDVNSNSVVHFYKDITFPVSTSAFTLTFWFKGYGESSYDDMTVRYSEITSTPVAGSTFSNGTLLGTNYQSNSSWTQKSISLPAAAFSGKTMRLVFTWRNDSSYGTQPPAAIDNISITGTGAGYTYTEFIFGETGTQITGNTELYLKWFPSYTITFNPNYDDGTVITGTTGVDGKLAAFPTPTRNGYTFGGWFTTPAATGGTEITANMEFSANTTIYARWTPIPYTITYNLGGGVATNPASYTVSSAAITLSNPAKTGYTFAGWTGTDITEAQATVTIPMGSMGNREYTANWTPNPAVVRFNLDGGSGIVPDSINTVYDATLAAAQKPPTASFSKTGYANDGKWYTRVLNTATPSVVSTEDFEKGANGWIFVNGATNANGTQKNKWVIGTATSYAGSYSTYISYTTDSAYSYSYISASNAHFYKNITFPESSADFTLTFYFRGTGESCCDYMSVKYSDTSAALPVAGSVFNGDTVKGGTYIYGNSNWAQKTLTLPAAAFSGKTMRLVFSWVNDTFNVDEASPAAIDNISITGTLSDYSYTEFMFGEAGVGTPVNDNTTLYLRWFPPIIISFNPNGGSVATSSGIAIGGTLDSLPIPNRAYYTFDGWYTMSKGGEMVTLNTIFTADTTIYAQWLRETPIIYRIATGNIRAQAIGNAIVLENLPKNAKVEVYNLQGKQVYSTTSHSPLATNHLKILVQTKGMYIVKAGTQTIRVAVR
jgi:uncharacterized repeat protein (TIGR02543 family)